MKISISLDIRNSHRKYLNVSYMISDIEEDHLVLAFPTWSPGSYLIREYQSQVESLEVKDANGKGLRCTKISKCQWRIATSKTSQIELTYRVYGNELNVRSFYADHEMVFCNPTSAMFHVEDRLDLPVSLRILSTKGWSMAYAPLASNGRYEFCNFDDLYDAPILCARQMAFEKFKVRGVDYVLAMAGTFQESSTKIAADLKALVEKEAQIFQGLPLKRYVFQVMFAPGAYGGLEHAFSSSNMFDGAQLADKKEYQKFLALLAHEHFHLWNVKRIRPVELGPFDYTTENYTRDLWIAEGVTSFYDDHILLRTGLYSLDEYLSVLSQNITRLESNKSVRVNSLEDSSFDAWIRFYRQNENSMNTVVSYYLKGGLISMILDILIIVKTKGRKNLDDVMLNLFRLYQKRPGKGISRDEFFEAATAVSGFDTRQFELDFIKGTKPADWRKYLSMIGVECAREIKKDTNYLGVVLSQSGSKVTVSGIAEDGPAFDSKLQPKDEILAIDEERIESTKQLDGHLKKKSLKILFARRGRVYEENITLSKHPQPPYTLKLKKKFSTEQKRNLKAFLRKK